MKKFIALMLIAAVISIPVSGLANWREQYPWAVSGVEYCAMQGILTGDSDGNLLLGESLTRSQMAKILVETFSLKMQPEQQAQQQFVDIGPDNWAYKYAQTIEPYMLYRTESFNGDIPVSREEFIATLVLATGRTAGSVGNREILNDNFKDADLVSPVYKELMCIAVESGYVMGNEGKLNPDAMLTRAEVCTMIYRVLFRSVSQMWSGVGVSQPQTPLLGKAQIGYDKAQQWARDRGAEQLFIDAAPIYWKYGEMTGIRPEIMYAQAAKETGYGRYTGAVKPEMNNFAGIKIKSPVGDRTEDHETFATRDDGVRAHFNHMCAYIGLKPIGEPHDRYYVVKSIDWAGTIDTVEGLGGRWCPDKTYGESIVRDLLEPMMKYAG